MKETTRDNVIYLAVALSIAGLVAFDAFYADSHGRRMWLPSSFAIRTVGYMGILAYFVVREIRKINATTVQTIICVLVASALHLGIAFLFPNIIGGHFGPELWIFAVAEMFLIVQLMVLGVNYFRREKHHSATRL